MGERAGEGGPAKTAPSSPPSRVGEETGGEVRIERLILHHLDHRTNTRQLVEEPATLDEQSAAFFAAHISAATARADWRAHFAEPDGEVATLCRQLLAPATFVAASQALAQRLYDQMRPRQIAPGDFVAIVYTLSGAQAARPQIALLKLDPDSRLARTFSHAHGHLRVSIRAASNLLPPANALQKCALLREAPSDTAPTDFAVTLLDTQAGLRSEGVAAFFYRGFLGVALALSARRRTRLFLSATETWLDAHRAALTPTALFAFYGARRAALGEETIALATFAQAALPTQPDLRADLRATLVAALFPSPEPPAPSFTVDRATADPVVRTVTLELDGGARLKIPAEQFEALVRVDPRRVDARLRLVIETLTLKEANGV
jgi:hypothetical protein